MRIMNQWQLDYRFDENLKPIPCLRGQWEDTTISRTSGIQRVDLGEDTADIITAHNTYRITYALHEDHSDDYDLLQRFGLLEKVENAVPPEIPEVTTLKITDDYIAPTGGKLGISITRHGIGITYKHSRLLTVEQDGHYYAVLERHDLPRLEITNASSHGMILFLRGGVYCPPPGGVVVAGEDRYLIGTNARRET